MSLSQEKYSAGSPGAQKLIQRDKIMAAPTNNFFDVRDIAAETEIKPEQPQVPEPPQEVPGYLALKFTFAPSRGDMGGAFCIIFEGQSGKTIFQVFWLAKPYAKNVIIEPAKDWRNFVKRFPQLGPLDKDWGGKLQEQLKEILTPAEKRKLFENYTKAKLRQIESMLRRSFEASSQCVFSASIDAEPVARPELERAKVLKPLEPTAEELERKKKAEEEIKKQEEAEDEARKAQAREEGVFEGTLIKCGAVVDPVRGKPSSEINPGDIVEVSIEGEGASALVRKFLEENDIKPLFPVEEVKRLEGKTLIYVRINDEIRGFINITKDIRMKIKESPADVARQVRASHFVEDMFFFGLLGGALIGLIFVIRYFFL